MKINTALIPLIIIIILCCPFAHADEDYCDQLMKEALAVEKCYDARHYAKARKLMDALKAKPAYKDMQSRLACPNAVTGLIRKLDRMIEDKEGVLDTYQRFVGTVIEMQRGPYSGYFEVQDDHGIIKSFVWGYDAIFENEDLFAEGAKATIFYESDFADDCATASKIVAHAAVKTGNKPK